MALLLWTVFRNQQKHTGQETLSGIIEKCVLPVTGGICPGANDGLGCDLGIFFCSGLVCQVLRVLQPQIHVFVHHPQDIVSIGPGRIPQIQDGYLVAIVFFCNPCIVSEQVSLGIRTEKAHTAGAGIFDTGIEKVRRFADTGSADHQKMDVAGINQGRDASMGKLSAHHDSLSLRQVLSLSPQLWFVWDMGVGLFNLHICGKTGGPILPVPHGFGFDPVQVVVAGQEGDQPQQGEHPQARTYQDYDLCGLHFHTPLS
ncbi:hypothetical protein IMSAGC013_03058 [Lachnospiraceae bacterium]|nr:hypothetical protein IMSAGC013_03058 [Lachnospiraceae bacterium]